MVATICPWGRRQTGTYRARLVPSLGHADSAMETEAAGKE